MSRIIGYPGVYLDPPLPYLLGKNRNSDEGESAPMPWLPPASEMENEIEIRFPFSQIYPLKNNF